MNNNDMMLQDIGEYIIDNYENSCLASTPSYNELGKDDSWLLEEVRSFFVYELIGLCGCGDPDLAIDTIIKYLSIINETPLSKEGNIEKRQLLFKEKFGYDSVYDNGLLIFLAYILDDKGLTDHGSSIGGCWITELGNMCLYALNKYEEENS